MMWGNGTHAIMALATSNKETTRITNENKGEIMNAINSCKIENTLDENLNPAGGSVSGTGLEISWQNGPLGRGEDRKEPNGAFIETVISAAIQRIEWYQNANGGKFKCRENAIAITKLEEANLWLNKRTTDREARQVEGTHQK